MEYLASIKHVVSSLFFSLSLLSGGSYTQPVTINYPVVDRVETVREVPVVGATISAAADFRTSLQSGITSSATSMTLVSLTSGSETLTSGGLYGFKLGGREYVLGYVSTTTANTISYMTRGVSRKTGTTTVSAYQSDWGRGTSVEITDAPLLLDLTEKANGTVGYENPLKYASSVATTTIDDSDQNLVNVGLLNYVAFNGAGVVDATSATRGVVELANQTETASSTSVGGSGNLVIPASNATSTYNQQTAPLRVVVTQNNGKIDSNFISTSSIPVLSSNNVFTGQNTFSTTTLLNPSAIRDANGNGAFFRFLASTTLAAPAASLTLSNIATSTFMRLYIYSPIGQTGTGVMKLTFNGDSGNNYSFGFASTTLSNGAGQAAISFSTPSSVSANVMAKFSVIDVYAVGSTTKAVNFSTSHYSGSALVPVSLSGSGSWYGSTNGAISSVTIVETSNNLQPGTIIYAFGSPF